MLEFRLDSLDGPLIAVVEGASANKRIHETSIYEIPEDAKGIRDLYMKVVFNGSGAGGLEWFRFSTED